MQVLAGEEFQVTGFALVRNCISPLHNRNKKIPVSIFVIVLLFCISCMNRDDCVQKEFSWLISEKKFLQQPTAGETNWYLIYELTPEQLDELLKDDFKEHNYQGWKRYTGSSSIGNKAAILIKGYRNNVMINLKEGSDSYNRIAMFIDLTEKKFVLFYGITYGL